MLIRAHDAARDDDEWRAFLREHDFGQLIVAARPDPIVVPTHFVLDGDVALLHLARANPVFDALAGSPRGTLAVVGAYAYVPSRWNAGEEGPPEWGIPTSYYAAVELTGEIEIVDDPAGIADILTKSLARFEPDTARVVTPGANPDARQFGAIRGIRLRVRDVRAKFKFGGNRPRAHRERVAAHLAERGAPLDLEAREHVLRRP